MKTIAEYAEEKNVTYEAIRKQLIRYHSELSGHIVKQGRLQFLDDYAINFLDEKRRHNVVIVKEDARVKELEQIRKDLEEAQNRIAAMKDEMLSAQKKIIELTEGREALIEERGQNRLLISDLNDTKEKLTKAEEENKKLRDELGSFKPSLFGLYRRT